MDVITDPSGERSDSVCECVLFYSVLHCSRHCRRQASSVPHLLHSFS